MKAYILAAGLGTRLYPLTKKITKVMLPIGDKPLLWYQIKLLSYYGFSDIMINLHKNPQQITDYFGDGKNLGIQIHYSYENKLLGTSGSIKKAKPFFDNETFLVLYGDNLTNYNILKLFTFHKIKKGVATIGLYESNEPWTQGVVIKNKDGMVIKFVEKPKKEEVLSNEVNSGIYFFESKIFDYIPDKEFSDFGLDVFPKLIKNGSVFALNTSDYIQDIGTYKRYEKAKRDFLQGKVKFPFSLNEK